GGSFPSVPSLCRHVAPARLSDVGGGDSLALLVSGSFLLLVFFGGRFFSRFSSFFVFLARFFAVFHPLLWRDLCTTALSFLPSPSPRLPSRPLAAKSRTRRTTAPRIPTPATIKTRASPPRRTTNAGTSAPSTGYANATSARVTVVVGPS